MSSTAPAPERERVPPAVRNGLLRPEELPPVAPLPDDPATRDARYLELARMLERWAKEPPAGDEPEWEVAELFPPGRVR